MALLFSCPTHQHNPLLLTTTTDEAWQRGPSSGATARTCAPARREAVRSMPTGEVVGLLFIFSHFLHGHPMRKKVF
jgi:hypothetical protein